MAISLMLLAAAFQIFDGVQAVNLGILRGLEDVNVPLWITLSAYWVIAIPLGYWLGISMDYGIFGIWIGLTSGLVITATSLSIRFYNRLRKQ
jgi:MATE family multidrug resistance protein